MDPSTVPAAQAAGQFYASTFSASTAAGCIFSPAEDGGVRPVETRQREGEGAARRRAGAGPATAPTVGARINRTISSSSDALSGDPTRAAIASSAAGMVQASLLLPMNTVQTQMQTRGMSLREVLRNFFRNGPVRGLANLYRALAPTVAMLGARQGLKFGAGASFKRRLPLSWPEPARDACAGGLSALTSTTLLFPVDTLKTRWQMGMATPRLDQMYQGFRPAASYSAFGMALWVMMRNALERNLPEPVGGSALAYWKHFFCGGLAGVCVQVPTFPFDTLKKRLQASDAPRAVFHEAQVLFQEGGAARFYRGFTLKCGFVALNGAIFNTVFVGVRRVLGAHEERRAT